MSRLSRRFVAALVWIAIAVLPVRGLAATVMPGLMSDMAPAMATSAPTDETAVATPCHAASQDVTSDTDATHACALCDLCHSSVAAAPASPAVMPVLHDVQPVGALPRAVEPRAPDGLFRPPRTSLG